MKKWKLTNNDKETLVKEFKDSLELYGDDAKDLVVSFEKKLDEKPAEKINIFFTPLAYLRCEALVRAFKGEVGWHGLMQKTGDNSYLIYDIMLYPQDVNGARTLDPTKDNAWYDKYDDVIDVMRFQAHSHVDMSTHPSDTDIRNQRNVVKNGNKGGVFLFQIWNKKGDINSFFYDLDNNLLYDRNDINIEIVDEGCDTLKKFVEESKEWVEDMGARQATNITPLILPEGSPLLQQNQETSQPAKPEYEWKAPDFWEREREVKRWNPDAQGQLHSGRWNYDEQW